ncbi:hypothetical protein Dimus_019444 [Dionaea muscipula]
MVEVQGNGLTFGPEADGMNHAMDICAKAGRSSLHPCWLSSSNCLGIVELFCKFFVQDQRSGLRKPRASPGSCIKVALDFVSPENVQECIRLTEEFRVLPKNHRAKEDKFEIKKMMLHAVTKALCGLRRITGVPSGSVNGEDHRSGRMT